MTALWHEDPNLQGRFHPQYPDDLQVMVHEGSLRFTDRRPEIMWARIYERVAWSDKSGQEMYGYKATLLNAPNQLKTVKLGDAILLVAHQAYKHVIRVTNEYMEERVFYDITPCSQCGLPEVFDPISRLRAKSFPHMKPDEELVYFTSFCPLCGGILLIQLKDHLKNNPPAP